MDYETTIEIAADPDRVWSTWIDVERWPEWTQSVVTARRLDDGEFGVGSRTRIKQPKLPAAVWEVTEAEPGRSFVWVTRTGGLTMIASHVVEPSAAGATAQLTYEITGPLSGLIGRLLSGRIRTYLRLEADGVKSRSEEG
jgi:uncharacterized protein YndB with AHSA1/START domain